MNYKAKKYSSSDETPKPITSPNYIGAINMANKINIISKFPFNFKILEDYAEEDITIQANDVTFRNTKYKDGMSRVNQIISDLGNVKIKVSKENKRRPKDATLN